MRLADAEALVAANRNDAGAYYLGGYAVERAIKACIARNRGEYPSAPAERAGITSRLRRVYRYPTDWQNLPDWRTPFRENEPIIYRLNKDSSG